MRAFDFLKLLDKNMVIRTLKIGFFIAISCRDIKSLIALVGYLKMTITNFYISEFHVWFKGEFRP